MALRIYSIVIGKYHWTRILRSIQKQSLRWDSSTIDELDISFSSRCLSQQSNRHYTTRPTICNIFKHFIWGKSGLVWFSVVKEMWREQSSRITIFTISYVRTWWLWLGSSVHGIWMWSSAWFGDWKLHDSKKGRMDCENF